MIILLLDAFNFESKWVIDLCFCLDSSLSSPRLHAPEGSISIALALSVVLYLYTSPSLSTALHCQLNSQLLILNKVCFADWNIECVFDYTKECDDVSCEKSRTYTVFPVRICPQCVQREQALLRSHTSCCQSKFGEEVEPYPSSLVWPSLENTRFMCMCVCF